MVIDYSSEDVYSSDSTFNGVDEEGNKFMIYANWNSDDGWNVDRIVWFEKEGNEDEIIELFLSDNN